MTKGFLYRGYKISLVKFLLNWKILGTCSMTPHYVFLRIFTCVCVLGKVKKRARNRKTHNVVSSTSFKSESYYCPTETLFFHSLSSLDMLISNDLYFNDLFTSNVCLDLEMIF